jgi:hypothetical protein
MGDQCPKGLRENAEDLGRKVVDLEKMCQYDQELERKDKCKTVVVDKPLLGTNTRFTQQVADYHLLKKFKVS